MIDTGFNSYRRVGRTLLWFLLFLFLFFPWLPSASAQTGDISAALVVSRHIKPYMDALDGLRRSLNRDAGIEHSAFVLEQYDLEQPQRIIREILARDFDVLISIGPEAASISMSISEQSDLTTIYTMVHNPAILAQDANGLGCGMALRIPAINQLRDINDALPEASKLGLLFDPNINNTFFELASKQSEQSDLELIPLRVQSSRDIPEVLREHWAHVDAIWLIPDQTVISQTLIEYIIKQALLHGKPVIGYNRFFYDSGAAIAFAFDFGRIGEQTAGLTEELLRYGYCPSVTPAYDLLINHRVFRSLSIDLPGANQ